jgi:hypothetical protein
MHPFASLADAEDTRAVVLGHANDATAGLGLTPNGVTLLPDHSYDRPSCERVSPYGGAIVITYTHHAATSLGLPPDSVSLIADDSHYGASRLGVAPDACAAITNTDHAASGFRIRLSPHPVPTLAVAPSKAGSSFHAALTVVGR